MKWYQVSRNDIVKQLNTSETHGLSHQEAEKRRKKIGENVLAEEKKPSRIFIFLKQFEDFMVLVLLAATLISGLIGEYVDAITIMAIVLLNAVLGYFQEQKAEKSLEKLKELSAPMAKVLREGEWTQIPSKDLVPGDIVKLETGDRVSADIRLIKTSSLEIEESMLTGESHPAEKMSKELKDYDLELGDQHNMAFSGTLVTRGNGFGVVVGTGMSTAMGKIASMLSTAKRKPTPLERKLEELGKVLIAAALVLTALVVILGVYQGHSVYNMFLAGVSLAVAAIPEGLPAIVTVALSLGVQRMIKRRAVVRKLSAVETLGCASVVCSDKTGTLTKNEMTVQQIYLPEQGLVSVSGKGYSPAGYFYQQKQKKSSSEIMGLEKLLIYGMLCNHASIREKDGKYMVEGDPTEGALVVAAQKAGIERQQLNAFKVIHEIPFDSARKRMTVVIEDANHKRYVITKGAPEVLLNRTNWLYACGEKKVMTPTRKKELESQMDGMANQALRTLALCYKPIDHHQSLKEVELEKNMIFLGLFGMMDPPREDVKESIEACREAGVKTVMITGDHARTARAIADQLNILPENGNVLSGYDLSMMTADELSEIIDDVYVFARVSPEHKLQIVEAFQRKGHVVAMTGDGVNDAPAIKASDIGVSMGITGTDVTKEASSLILMDDHFATIKAAIEEGRNIYENIRKFIRYLLASNVGEILVMFFAMLLALPLPLVPVQILWVNLVTDGLPALALGLDQPEKNVMKRPPRHPNESIFARGLAFKIITRGFMIGLVTLIAFMFAYRQNPEHLEYAQTVAFVTLVLAQLIHVFDCRSDQSVFARNPFGNMYLVGAVISSLLLMLVVVYYPPLQPIFHTVSLPLREWLMILALSAIPTIIFGAGKSNMAR